MNDLVLIKRDEAVCTSLQVAEKFHKKHKSVIRNIENLAAQNCAAKSFYHLSSYTDIRGKRQKLYYMNRDGFSLLAMGFTGKEALDFKLAFINAFNLMEKTIQEIHSQEHISARESGKQIRKTETDEIKNFVEYALSSGSGHADKYYTLFSKMANKIMNVSDRNTATVEQLIGLAFIEGTIRRIISDEISRGIYYKDIFKDCKRQALMIANISCLQLPA